MNYSRIVYFYLNGILKKVKVSKLKANFMIGYYHPILILDKYNNIIEYSNLDDDIAIGNYYRYYLSKMCDKGFIF